LAVKIIAIKLTPRSVFTKNHLHPTRRWFFLNLRYNHS